MPLKELASYTKVIGDLVMQNPGAPEERGGSCPGVDGENGPVFTTLSHHMTKLMMAGLVTSERRGIYVLPNQHGVPPLAHCANQSHGSDLTARDFCISPASCTGAYRACHPNGKYTM